MRFAATSVCLLLLWLSCSSVRSDEPVSYANHADLTQYRDTDGVLRPIRSAADWQIRRKHILQNVQRVMGPLPKRDQAVPLDIKVVAEVRVGATPI